MSGIRGTSDLRITKLIIFETGTYNKLYRRPYATTVTGDVVAAMHEAIDASRDFSPATLAKFSNQIIRPSANPEKEIYIPGGFEERRLKFMMEVEYERYGAGKICEIITGYTDHPGITNSGHIDPRMTFFINNIMKVRNTTMRTATGLQSFSNVVESNQVLADNSYTNVRSSIREQRMRPEDVFATMGRVFISGIEGEETTYDARVALTNIPVFSKRSNNSAAVFSSDILSSYSQAQLEARADSSQDEMTNRARTLSSTDQISKNPFLYALSQIRETVVNLNTFTFGELKTIDMNVDHVTIARSQAMMQSNNMHRSGQTADWGGSDVITNTATVLATAVPSLMTDLALMVVGFKATNREIGGRTVVVPTDAQGFGNSDVSENMRIFLNRLQSEILIDVSYNNQIDYDLEMHVDLLGDAIIRLSMGAENPVDFVIPSFCDALLTPVVSMDNNRIVQLARDFQSLTTELVDNYGASMAMMSTSFGGVGNSQPY